MAVAWTLAALMGAGVVAWFTATLVEQHRKRKAFDELSGWPMPEDVPSARVVYLGSGDFNEDKWYWEDINGPKE